MNVDNNVVVSNVKNVTETTVVNGEEVEERELGRDEVLVEQSNLNINEKESELISRNECNTSVETSSSKQSKHTAKKRKAKTKSKPKRMLKKRYLLYLLLLPLRHTPLGSWTR